MPKETKEAAQTASSIITGKIPMLQVPPSASHEVRLEPAAAIDSHIVAYYYAALTNLFCQGYFPDVPQLGDTDIVKAIVDSSYGDFCSLDISLGALDPNEIQASPNSHLYQEVRDEWRGWVKDWAAISHGSNATGELLNTLPPGSDVLSSDCL
jgi:hypothetical protein